LVFDQVSGAAGTASGLQPRQTTGNLDGDSGGDTSSCRLSVNTWAKIKRNIPASDFEIQVTAKQFNWDVVIPAPTAPGTKTTFDNDLHVP
jgi:hypothetical protein